MDAQHRYYEPWSARRMEGYVPFLADLSKVIRKEQANLVAQILNQYLGHGRRRSAIAGCETLLSFDTWYRLVRSHGLGLAETRRILLRGMLSIIDPGTTGDMTFNPRRKSQ
jgi:hypothetical protein